MEWYRPGEQWPTPLDNVLVVDEHGDYHIGYLTKGGGWKDTSLVLEGIDCDCLNISWWTYLPEPPSS